MLLRLSCNFCGLAIVICVGNSLSKDCHPFGVRNTFQSILPKVIVFTYIKKLIFFNSHISCLSIPIPQHFFLSQAKSTTYSQFHIHQVSKLYWQLLSTTSVLCSNNSSHIQFVPITGFLLKHKCILSQITHTHTQTFNDSFLTRCTSCLQNDILNSWLNYSTRIFVLRCLFHYLRW